MDARQRATRNANAALLLISLVADGARGPVFQKHHAPPTSLPIVSANDNRRSAGTLRGDTLVVQLEVRLARWYPEASDGPFVDLPVLQEVGQAPQIPGPLLRVPEGTTIEARLANGLSDSAVTFAGLQTRGEHADTTSVTIAPGQSTVVRFKAGRAGTYAYGARVGTVNWEVREREQLYGALVIDSPVDRTDDRIIVLNVWGEPRDSTYYQNALAINGRSWPFTERLSATVGDTLRWRVVNATVRPHPLHLHGFYYRVLSKGDSHTDKTYLPAEQRSVVTETMLPFETMRMEWVAERPGNWLFHCHLSFHVVPESRLESTDRHADHMSGDAGRHMAGLVLGISVKPRAGDATAERRHVRQLQLFVQEGRPRGRAKRALGYVLQQKAAPAPDSVEISGTPLILTRGEPTDITVTNRLAEPTAVHWHGIELESYSDGVAGWSGTMTKLAPMIPPGKSFTAQLTLRRAGTFIYHTHLNDIEQLTSGLYGPIIVLEPGARFDAKADHPFVIGWDGRASPPHLLVNGDSLPAPLVLARGVRHRMRFIDIGAVGGDAIQLLRGDSLVEWRAVAKDGADLSAPQRIVSRAAILAWAGETYDFEFLASNPGTYRLVIGDPKKPQWQRQLIVP